LPRIAGGLLLPAETAEEDIPFFAEVTAGGRITIPEEIRKIFEIKDGDAVFCRLKIIPKKRNSSAPKETKPVA
jgi:bifunctional DNA-binding transcriptional regulator/antitoxin component of YhaV-PrlF toxin-antitoxin module